MADYTATVPSSWGQDRTFDYLVYETVEAQRPSKLVYRAETDSIVSVDTITVATDSSVTYDAHLELKGLRKVADPLMEIGLTRASDKARDGLAEQLA